MNLEQQGNDLFQRFWTWRLQNAPEFATSIGVHDYDSRLDEMSLASYGRRKDAAANFLAEIETMLSNSAFLSQENDSLKLNLKLLQDDLQQFVHGFQFFPYLYPVNRLEGPQLDFPRLLSWMKTDSVGDMEKIIARLRFFQQQIDETIFSMREGIRNGFVMHKISVQPVPGQLLKVAESPCVENSPLFVPFKQKPVNISDETWTDLVTTAKSVICDVVQPSYKKLASFLEEEYMPNTRAKIGASSLPKGESYYSTCLKFHTTTELTPQEVHVIGVEEVKRITRKMEEIKEQVKFNGTLDDFRHHLRTDVKFKFKNEEDILSHYKSIAKKIEEVLPKYFKRMPRAKFEIVPVPKDVAPTYPGAYYLAAPQDGSRPGTFFINTYKPESRAKYEAVSLCLHEAEPGHHLQSALTMESGTLVDFRRFMEDRKYYEPPARFGMNTGYVEGWGLYSEFLGEEMGLYGDLYDLFGRLSHEMLRACRLVVDTGMHALGWSREQAIAYMESNTAADMHDITGEIDRYITWPGQACGYKIGELKIKELRAKSEKALRDRFDVREFHDFIASMGGVPLKILEQQVEEFITRLPGSA